MAAGAAFRRIGAAVCMAALLLLSGCASLPPQGQRNPSVALQNPEQTRFGQEIARRAPQPGGSGSSSTDPGSSGFRLVISGEDAYASLRQLIGHAGRTLDLQYYLIENDEPTRALLREIRRAADRGVRVRLLVDDLHTVGRDGALMRYARHPNIEVRVFNPFPAGRASLLTRVLASAFDARRINRRMHNKILIADNSVCLTGGRNLGSRYFLRHEANNFVDLDVLAAGAIVAELSRSFDQYWNDDLAYPIQALTHARTVEPPAERKRGTRRGAGFQPRTVADVPDIDRGFDKLAWIPARAVSDAPSKIVNESDRPAADETLINDIGRMLRTAREEVIIVTPYFVPGERGMKHLGALRERGVRVRILTNSLASTDAPIVHASYARYRRALLDLGIELYELRPTLSGSGSLGSFGSSRASLHSKAIVVDRSVLFVGSMNLDPRSISQNTEMGIFMDSGQLASTIATLFEETVRDDSYRLELGQAEVGQDTPGQERLHWIDNTSKGPVIHTHEPEASLLRRMESYLLGRFAPEDLL